MILYGLFFSQQAQAGEVFYAEPYTGKKVSEYLLTLPSTDKKQINLQIPQGCPLAQEEYLSGAGRFGNQVQKRLWEKVNNDCSLYQLLGSQQAPENDFVSQFDFMNARILDLPIMSNCDHLPADQDLVRSCAPMDVRPINFSFFLSFIPRPMAEGQDMMQPCRFSDGVFRGYFYMSPDGLRCQDDTRAGGLRILSVNFADVNGDGYQDAVLRISPLGPSVSRRPMILPLTRFSDQEKLVFVEGIRP